MPFIMIDYFAVVVLYEFVVARWVVPAFRLLFGALAVPHSSRASQHVTDINILCMSSRSPLQDCSDPLISLS